VTIVYKTFGGLWGVVYPLFRPGGALHHRERVVEGYHKRLKAFFIN